MQHSRWSDKKWSITIMTYLSLIDYYHTSSIQSNDKRRLISIELLTIIMKCIGGMVLFVNFNNDSVRRI